MRRLFLSSADHRATPEIAGGPRKRRGNGAGAPMAYRE